MTPIEVLAMSADELEAEIVRLDAAYAAGAPIIEDTLYDLMVEQLRAQRPASPVLQRVGAGEAELSPDGAKVTHEHVMLSLDKCYSEAELRRWFERFDGAAVASHKIDGVALSLRYDAGGELSLAATRGTGRVGEAVTDNARYIGGVPAQVARGGIEVRGEVYMPVSTFRERYAEKFANPRNLAAGALKQKDPEKTGAYGLRFFAYEALGLDDIATEWDKRGALAQLGFEPSPGQRCNVDDAQATFEALSAARESNDFETDGIVFKVDDCARYAELGLTAHHPRGAIAYKYQGESGFSKLVDVAWSVSRSGAVNPIALIEPVSLSGVRVSRVSLHNLAIIERLAGAPLVVGGNTGYPLSAGARVLVTRRGGVIPHIEQVADAGTSTLTVPLACPTCGAPTARDGDVLMAPHDDTCTSQAVRVIQHFTAVADIQGFGPKVLEQLFDRGLLSAPADLYRLSVDALADLDRLGRKSAQNLVDAVDARRRLPLPTFLAALGIPDLGTQMARVVGASLVSLDAVRAAEREALEAVAGVGPIVSVKIVDGLKQRAAWIDALLEHVTVDDAEPVQVVSGPLDGLSFVFTGALDTMRREDAQADVRALGGSTPSGVSGELRYLVLGDGDFARFEGGWRSSKLQKAEKLIAAGAPLQIISESEFHSILRAARG